MNKYSDIEIETAKNLLYAKEDVDPKNLITKWLDMEHKTNFDIEIYK